MKAVTSVARCLKRTSATIQGRTQVNDDIQKSLLLDDGDDFWWLNNGVSVLSSKASLGGKTLTVEDPQIVNGLQTSTEIFEYFTKANTDDDERNVLVRVIVPVKDDSRDRIIKATNSQTVVQQASLRATDRIHRDIEEYLRPRGLFYDRRKNHYKNEGKPRDKIVSIPHLAQSVMAIYLQRPDTARGRPSSLLKKDEDYRKVYNPDYPINVYFVCAESMRRVEAYLKSSESDLPAKDRNNLKFYVGLETIVSLCGTSEPRAEDLAGLDVARVDAATIEFSLSLVRKEYQNLGGDDKVAKGSSLLEAIRQRWNLDG